MAAGEAGDPEILATFGDGSPAAVGGRAGRGRVICCGFLPALAYIKAALDERRPLQERADERKRLAAEAREEAPANRDRHEAAAAANPALTGQKAPDDARAGGEVDRSYNPWRYPAGIRERIVAPARAAGVHAPLTCDTPIVDAVALPCEQGVLAALSNYTLRTLGRVELTLDVTRRSRASNPSGMVGLNSRLRPRGGSGFTCDWTRATS